VFETGGIESKTEETDSLVFRIAMHIHVDCLALAYEYGFTGLGGQLRLSTPNRNPRLLNLVASLLGLVLSAGEAMARCLRLQKLRTASTQGLVILTLFVLKRKVAPTEDGDCGISFLSTAGYPWYFRRVIFHATVKILREFASPTVMACMTSSERFLPMLLRLVRNLCCLRLGSLLRWGLRANDMVLTISVRRFSR